MPRTRSRILPIGYESEPRSAFADEPLQDGERWGYDESLHSWYWGVFAAEHLVKSAVLCGERSIQWTGATAALCTKCDFKTVSCNSTECVGDEPRLCGIRVLVLAKKCVHCLQWRCPRCHDCQAHKRCHTLSEHKLRVADVRARQARRKSLKKLLPELFDAWGAPAEILPIVLRYVGFDLSSED